MAIPQTQFDVFAFNRATAAPVSGDAANITAELRKDYGAFVATAEVNPAPVSGKPGFYRFGLTAGERDVEIELRIFPVSATSGIEVIGVPAFYAAPTTAASVGDWAIARTFETAGGDKVSGVRMSLVGVAGKTDTTGTDGVATIKADEIGRAHV